MTLTDNNRVQAKGSHGNAFDLDVMGGFDTRTGHPGERWPAYSPGPIGAARPTPVGLDDGEQSSSGRPEAPRADDPRFLRPSGHLARGRAVGARVEDQWEHPFL